MASIEDRLLSAHQALRTLREVYGLDLPPVVKRDLLVLRFTYTFEALWKTCQAVLHETDALTVHSPKSAIRYSRQVGILSDEEGEAALKMANDRNVAAHVYNEEIAEQVALRMEGHIALLQLWLSGLERIARSGRS
jgi:nucleotidyltransferase substrate binding protein (TIGR01987 family)